MEKGNKKIIRGWVFYDWANSVYNLVISSAIFPLFYDFKTKAAYIKANQHLGDNVSSETIQTLVKEIPEGTYIPVNFFGWEFSSSVLYSFVLSLSFLVVSFLSPLLSGVADYSGSKKKFLKFFCYLGAFSCMTLNLDFFQCFWQVSDFGIVWFFTMPFFQKLLK